MGYRCLMFSLKLCSHLDKGLGDCLESKKLVTELHRGAKEYWRGQTPQRKGIELDYGERSFTCVSISLTLWMG